MTNEILLELFFKIVVLIAFGFVLKKTGVLTNELQKGLSTLLIKAILPMSILASANGGFSASMGKNLLICTAACIIYYVFALASGAWIAKRISISQDDRGVFVAMCAFANSAFLGIPLVNALYGSEGVMYAVIFNLFWQLFLFTAGVRFLSGAKKTELSGLLRDPATVCSIIAILIFISPFRMPAPVVEIMDDIGSMCFPISMLVIGGGLADMPVLRLLKEKNSYIVSGLRLVLYPALMFAAAAVLKFPPVLAGSCVVLTAMPVGSLNAVMAERYGHKPDFAVCTVIQSTVLMLATLPFVIFMVGKFLM